MEVSLNVLVFRRIETGCLSVFQTSRVNIAEYTKKTYLTKGILDVLCFVFELEK